MSAVLSTPKTLAAEQVEAYERDGFLVLRSVFNAEEIAMLAAECDTLVNRQELIDTQNIRCRWQNHVETRECTFDCFDPVIDIGPVCRYFAYDERILAPLRDIYRDEAHLFKDKLIFKRPGMTGYALHQDFIGWASFPESFITVLVAIDATDADNGATEVFAGYHTQGYLSPRDGEYHQLAEDAVDLSTGVVLDLSPGDVAMFGGFTPHRSAPNRSSKWRRQLYLSYNAGRDGGQRRDAHYREFHEWLVKKYAEYGKHGVWFK
jgi:ectoine hydroxylase-related dioxygenase (phytanoyl-CoA dioxygenase family)